MIRRARETDIDEVLPYCQNLGPEAKTLLRRSMADIALTGLVGDRVACMFGLRFPKLLASRAQVWMVPTPLVLRHKMEFLRESRRFVAWASGTFGELEGCVDQANSISLRWLEWLGFRQTWVSDKYIGLRLDVE